MCVKERLYLFLTGSVLVCEKNKQKPKEGGGREGFKEQGGVGVESRGLDLEEHWPSTGRDA